MALQNIVDVLRIGSASGSFDLPFDKMPVTSPIISNRRICCSSVNKERTLQTIYCYVRGEEGTSVNKYAFGVKAYAGAYLFLCGGHIGQTNKIISVYSLAFISLSISIQAPNWENSLAESLQTARMPSKFYNIITRRAIAYHVNIEHHYDYNTKSQQ